MLSIRKRWRIGELLVRYLNDLGFYGNWEDLGHPSGSVPYPTVRILRSVRNVTELHA